MEISIHSPYTGRDYRVTEGIMRGQGISIHSPYTGRDASECPAPLLPGYFNPLSLYRERRQKGLTVKEKPLFQSTLPIQGETRLTRNSLAMSTYFNPLSLYRERQQFCT